MNDIDSKWNTDGSWTYFDGSYDDLVAKFGIILESHCFGSYQGDYAYLLESVNGYGFVVVGYGSCSGCDALEACSSLEEVKELQEYLGEGIKWFPTLDEVKEYALHADQELQWYYHESGWEEFEDKVKTL